MMLQRHPGRHLVAALVALTALASCSSDDDSASTTEAADTTEAPSTTGAGPTSDASASTEAGTVCEQTTAPPDQTFTFIFSHTDESQGVDSEPGASFMHVLGVAIVTPAENTQPLSVTVSVLDGPTIATIDDIPPGSTCGIDHDFAPGDYFVRSSDGNGTQFTSFPDE